jgi:hypothetical protein
MLPQNSNSPDCVFGEPRLPAMHCSVLGLCGWAERDVACDTVALLITLI